MSAPNRAAARPCGLPDQGRTLVASSTFDALKATSEERLALFESETQRSGALAFELATVRAELRIVRAQRDAAEAQNSEDREKILVAERALEREKREHRATFLELEEARDWLDGHGMCGNEDCEHVRPRGESLCAKCDTARDQRGL